MKQKIIDLFNTIEGCLSIMEHDCEKYGNCEDCVNWRTCRYPIPYECGMKCVRDNFRDLRYEIEQEEKKTSM